MSENSPRRLVALDEWLEYQEGVFEEELHRRNIPIQRELVQAELVDGLVEEIASQIAAHPDSDFVGTGSRGDYVEATVRALNAALANLACTTRVTVKQLQRAVDPHMVGSVDL